MSEQIFKAVRASAERMGACEPRWLLEGHEPEFSVLDAGTAGPPVILLHGLFGAMSNWDAVFPLLKTFCRPIAFEFPILTAHRSEVRVKALAAYLEYYIRKNNLAPVALCGNSLGGHVALRLCLTSPELVQGLVLSGTSGLYEHSVDSLPVRPGKEFVRDHMARVFHSERFITDEAVNEVAVILSSRLKHLNLIHAARSAKKDNLQNYLPNIKAPTLLLWGLQDEVTTMEVAETFHRLIPNSKLITIDESGHAPMIEHPQWFSDEVKKFLESRGALTSKG